MTTERHEFWVCTDCYFAHHYGAHSETREATEAEVAHWLHSEHNTYHAREVMGLEFDETPEGVQVTEWFAGESDQRCEGGEPLRLVPEDAEVYDWTCSNHEGHDWAECPHCGQDGPENGIHEFSRRSCDGCGSHLGGSRHRLAVDIDHQEVTA